MMVVPNEFGGLSVRSSKCVTADARDLGGEMQSCSHAVMQHASWVAGKRHARYEAAKSIKGVGLKLGLPYLKRDYFWGLLQC